MRWRPEDREALIEALAEGLDWPTLAGRLGRSASSCRGYAVREKLFVPARSDNALVVAHTAWLDHRRAEAKAWSETRRMWL